MSMVSMILVVLVAFLAGLGSVVDHFQFHQPLVACTLVGLVTGNLEAGVILGGTLQMIALSWANIGVAIAPDAALASIASAIILVLGGQGVKGVSTAIAVAIPLAVAGLFLTMFVRTLSVVCIHRMDVAADRADFGAIERWQFTALLFQGLRVAIPAAALLVIPAETVQHALESMPMWLTDGMSIGGGMVVAVGYAMVINMMATREVWPFFAIGFCLAAVSDLTLIGLGTIALAMALIYLKLSENGGSGSNAGGHVFLCCAASESAAARHAPARKGWTYGAFPWSVGCTQTRPVSGKEENDMSILKLKPTGKDYLWGGTRLAEEYGKEMSGSILAETWELSCHPDGPSYIADGPYTGLTLAQYVETQGKKVLGTHCEKFEDFPILIKFIDAQDNLSIQVHPDNHYALEHEGQSGKTEMWYVADAGKDASLYYGFRQEISKEEFAERIRKDTLLEVLNAVSVQKGDILFIEAGTIHAIGKNILIAEIQQNSNVTYRVYDYGRIGQDGKKRDLHIEKALDVTKRIPMVRDSSCYPHLADCDYFTVDKVLLDGMVMEKMEGFVSHESFVSILVLEGEGVITNRGRTIDFRKGDSLFLPAGSGTYAVEGICDALLTRIR